MRQGNPISLYNALYLLMKPEDDFYKTIKALLILKEIELSVGEWCESIFKHEGNDPSELELMRELFLKSPEEIEKIKEQLKNNE